MQIFYIFIYYLINPSCQNGCGTQSYEALCNIFSWPGRSQGLHYKQPRHYLIHSVSHSVSPSAFSSHSFTALPIPNGYKIDYVIVIMNFLNPEGHQIQLIVQKLRLFYWRGRFCLLVELQRWRVCDQRGYPVYKPFIYEARESNKHSFVCVYLDGWIYWPLQCFFLKHIIKAQNTIYLHET